MVAYCLAAVMAGCAAINGTLPGKGERTGYARLEGVLPHLIGLGMLPAQPDYRALNDLAGPYERSG